MQSVNDHNLDTCMYVCIYRICIALISHIPQTGETLSLMGHSHKFPEFSLILLWFPKFPEFSLIGKFETHFQGTP